MPTPSSVTFNTKSKDQRKLKSPRVKGFGLYSNIFVIRVSARGHIRTNVIIVLIFWEVVADEEDTIS